MAKFTANLSFGPEPQAPLPTFASGAPGSTIADMMASAAIPNVRYDTGPMPGEEQLRAYNPSMRDNIGAMIAGDSQPNSARYNFAQGLVGSAGAGKHGVGPWGMSVLDVPSPATGFGLASPLLDMQDAAQHGDTQGFKRAMTAIVPGANVEGKIAQEGESALANTLAKQVRPPYQRQLNDFGLYSFGAEQAYNLPQERGTVQQMRAILEKKGVKPAEFDHSGFSTAFPDPNAKVTRDQLVQHFEQNVPQLGTTERAVSHAYPYASSRQWQSAIQEAERRRDWDEVDRLTAAWEESEGLGGTGRNSPPPKYGSYTLPGGSAYREITTTYTDGEALRLDARRRELEKLGTSATPEEKSEWAEIMNRLQPDDRDLPGVERFKGFPQYVSSHWDGEKNILVHNRMKDREIGVSQDVLDNIGERIAKSIWPDGRAGVDNLAAGAPQIAVERGAVTPEEAASYSRHRGWVGSDYFNQKGLEQKLLHDEETQSDWGQAAHKTGVLSVPRRIEARQAYEELSRRVREAQQATTARMVALEEANPEIASLWDPDHNAEQHAQMLRNDPEYQRLIAEENALAQEQNAAEERWFASRKGVPSAPYIGNTSGWTQLGQKRSLWEAAQNDADALVWNTGKTQADRYNLANQVSEIAYDPRYNTLYGFDHDGRQVINQNASREEIKNYIGEEPAKALLRQVDAAEWERQQWVIQQNPETRRWEVIDPNGETLQASGGKPYDFDTETDAATHIDWMLEDDRASQYLSRYPTINGLDLQVGGEGMTGFYDNIYGKELRDLLKRANITKNPQMGAMHIKTDFDGWPYPVRIESDGENYWLAGRNPRGSAENEERLSHNFGSFNDAFAYRERFLDGYNQPVHSLQLTPEMKEAIKRGLPFFALPGAMGIGAAMNAMKQQNGAGEEL